jgi:hypothetical protein
MVAWCRLISSFSQRKQKILKIYFIGNLHHVAGAAEIASPKTPESAFSERKRGKGREKPECRPDRASKTI